MRAFFRRLHHRSHAAGQGLVEYALILALIAIVVIGSLTLVGRSTDQKLDEVDCALKGGKWHIDNGNGNSGNCR